LVKDVFAQLYSTKYFLIPDGYEEAPPPEKKIKLPPPLFFFKKVLITCEVISSSEKKFTLKVFLKLEIFKFSSEYTFPISDIQLIYKSIFSLEIFFTASCTSLILL